MNFITGLSSTASALNAEKARMDVIAENIANAHTTRDVNGEAYKRKVVTFESALDASTGTSAVRVSQIKNDDSPGETIHDPQHPHAGPDGMVHLPNVNTAIEMVDLISASRSYEANLSVVRNARQMALKALAIGK